MELAPVTLAGCIAIGLFVFGLIAARRQRGDDARIALDSQSKQVGASSHWSRFTSPVARATIAWVGVWLFFGLIIFYRIGISRFFVTYPIGSESITPYYVARLWRIFLIANLVGSVGAGLIAALSARKPSAPWQPTILLAAGWAITGFVGLAIGLPVGWSLARALTPITNTIAGRALFFRTVLVIGGALGLLIGGVLGREIMIWPWGGEGAAMARLVLPPGAVRELWSVGRELTAHVLRNVDWTGFVPGAIGCIVVSGLLSCLFMGYSPVGLAYLYGGVVLIPTAIALLGGVPGVIAGTVATAIGRRITPDDPHLFVNIAGVIAGALTTLVAYGLVLRQVAGYY